MIKISLDDNDDSEFLETVEKLFNRLIQSHLPSEIYLIKVDNWFDFKWRAFEGKKVGAVDSWNEEELKIPPFIPDRILEQSYFEKLGEIYKKLNIPDIHIYQTSSNNITGKRKLKAYSRTRLFGWLSGNTKNTLRGSLMIYQIEEKTSPTFYVSFLKKENWQIYKTDQISRNEVLNLIS